MTREVTIGSTVGLHASLAAKIVGVASRYSVTIELKYKDKIVDVKSILGLMSLAVPSGENVTLVAKGEDCEDAIKEIAKIIEKVEK